MSIDHQAELSRVISEMSALQQRAQTLELQLLQKAQDEAFLQQKIEDYFVQLKHAQREHKRLKSRIAALNSQLANAANHASVSKSGANKARLTPVLLRLLRRVRAKLKAILVGFGLLKSIQAQKSTSSSLYAEYLEVINKSDFFDTDFYLRNNADVAGKDINPAEHYLRYGGLEGRNPSSEFDSGWYLSQYPDVAAANMNPLLHYLLHGQAEGRLPKPD